MEDLMKRSIATVEAKACSEFPWTLDEPWNQPYHVFVPSDQSWQPNTVAETPHPTNQAPTQLALYAWNIDFMLPFPNSRMTMGIRHLQKLIREQSETIASVIYLQECLESDLEVLKNDLWIQQIFALSDTHVDNWQNAHYGTVTLVDKRLSISACFRIHYSETRMQRDVLVTDLRLSMKDKGISRKLRLCNTHLESLALVPARRPPQMKLTARVMHDSSVDGAVAAGDFNAIEPFDRTLHSENNVKDAYLELGGSEDDAENGHTWGQQAASVLRERFGTSRMDKVYFCGALRCLAFERFGADVLLQDERERMAIVGLGFDRPWITDHLGVKALFEVD